MAGRPVGFIGLGNMGGRMARCLVDAGHEVVGSDPEAERVTAAGARPAASPAAVAAEADVVLLSLPDSPVVERVMRGDEGVLAAAREGQIVVDLSTANAELDASRSTPSSRRRAPSTSTPASPAAPRPRRRARSPS